MSGSLKLKRDGLIFAGYTVFAMWLLRRMWIDPEGRVPPGHAPDPDLLKWFLAYAARAVTHFENPFFTTMTGYPHGVNVIGNASMLGIGVPLTPVTLVFGAGVTFLVAMTLGMAGSAAGWYLVLRRFAGSSHLAAAVGGAFCGFSPAMVSHALGHLHLAASFLIPFIVYLSLRLAQPGSRLRHGAVLGLLVTWQVFIGAELLLLCVLGLAVFVLGYAVAHRFAVREQATRLVKGLLAAGAVAVVLLAYPLWSWFLGPQSYSGLGHGASSFGADVWSFVRLPTQSLFGDRAINARFAQNYAEENTFFGPAIALAVLGSIALLFRRQITWVLTAVGAIFSVLALGAVVTFKGDPLGAGPWKPIGELPLFDSIIPTRLGMVVVPVIAALLALAIDDLRGLGNRWLWLRYSGLAALALALLTVVPTPLPGGPQPPVPRFIQSGAWQQYMGPGKTLVPVPLPSPEFSDSLRWAADTTIGFASPKGYFLRPEANVRGARGTFWGPERYTADVIAKVAQGGDVPVVGDADRRQAAEDVRFWNAAVFVLPQERSRAEELKRLLTELFGPPRAVDDVWIWDVRRHA